MSDCSIEELRAAFAYDPETGVITHKINRMPRVKAGAVAGHMSGNGYLYVSLNRKSYLAHRVALALIDGAWPINHVDHANGRRDDNRLCNIRHATPSQNVQNRDVRADSRSGIKGVAIHPHGKWRAKIRANGKVHHLGYFDTAEEAQEAHRLAAIRLHGEFARVA